MLGNSKEVRTVICIGQEDLDRWLRTNEVKVIDIKFGIHSEKSYSSQYRFLVLYQLYQ